VRVPFPETRLPSTGKSGDIGVQIARFSKCMIGQSCCSVATGRCGSACAPGSEDLADCPGPQEARDNAAACVDSWESVLVKRS